MKQMSLVGIFTFFFCCSSIYSAQSPDVEESASPVNNPDQLVLRQRPEDVRDQMMFSQGLTVLSSFGKILLDPENIPSVKQNAAVMLQGIVDFVQTAMRSIGNDLEQDEINE